MAQAAVRSVVDDSLYFLTSIVCGGSVLVSFLVLQSSCWAGCFTYFLQMSCDC